jgi:polyisoprenoid-binding protein YceI
MSTHGTHTVGLVGIEGIEATRWRLDPARSSVDFRVKALWGLVAVKGSFARYRGKLDLADRPAVDLVVEAASLDSGNEKRDAHLRSPDFFDVERHRHIRFVSTSVEPAGERLRVDGILSAAGGSVPLKVEATLRRAGEELEIEVEADVDQRALGIVWNRLGTVRSPSRAIIRGRLVREER